MSTRTDASGTMTFTHDADGRFLTAQTGTSTLEYRYDALGLQIVFIEFVPSKADKRK